LTGPFSETLTPMRTPPFIVDDEVTSTLRHLRKRHVDANDPTWGMITRDVRGTLDYLREYRGPDHVRRADVINRETLQVRLWWDDRARERDTLIDGIRWGWTQRELGGPLGISTAQGFRDRLDRLNMLLDGHRPDEKLARDARRAARVTKGVEGDVRARWLAEHRRALRTAAAGVLDVADRVGVTCRDWLDELAADLEADAWTPGSIAVLGLAVADVRSDLTFAALSELERTRTYGGPLRDADELRSGFAGFGKSGHADSAGGL
jgi:hypothetical protein